MKNLTLFSAITAIALLFVISGCATSGSNTENTENMEVATTNSEINADTLQVGGSQATTSNTGTSVDENTVTTREDADDTTTITGSTETTRPSRADANTIEVEGDASEKLDNYLRRVAGVFIIGDGAHARVAIRNIGSGNPLFIVDGMRWGHDWSQVYYNIRVSEIKNIRVLKGVEASMLYGIEGEDGAIEINLYGAREQREMRQ